MAERTVKKRTKKEVVETTVPVTSEPTTVEHRDVKDVSVRTETSERKRGLLSRFPRLSRPAPATQERSPSPMISLRQLPSASALVKLRVIVVTIAALSTLGLVLLFAFPTGGFFVVPLLLILLSYLLLLFLTFKVLTIKHL